MTNAPVRQHIPPKKNGIFLVKTFLGLRKSFRYNFVKSENIIEYAKELEKEISVTDYLIWGGFPKRFEFDSLEAQRRYLNDLDDTIIINDLIHRYRIRKENLFRNLVNYVLRSNSRIFPRNPFTTILKENMNPARSIPL